jgi:ubiquinone/menaquinone biosynthesis C-methylase UbiE
MRIEVEMSFYRTHIFPWLVDVSMRNARIRRYREALVPQAKGKVLEIGIGSGLNLPFYGSEVERLYGLDPSPELRAMAAKRAREAGRDVELLEGSAEEIALSDHSLDTVISTWTLCSIPDVEKALREIRRVLKPDGQLLFVEHGLAPEPNIQRWQHRLNRLWSRVSGGCNMDRKIDALIFDAGFHAPGLQTEYAQGPKIMTYMYRGRALPD